MKSVTRFTSAVLPELHFSRYNLILCHSGPLRSKIAYFKAINILLLKTYELLAGIYSFDCTMQQI